MTGSLKPFAVIVEDNEDQRWIYSSALEQAGFTVETIEDGQVAFNRLMEVTPSLIVLDLHIPHVPGNALLSMIRHDQRLADVFVILATADAQLADEIRSQADLVLLKPISFVQLSQLVGRYRSQLEKNNEEK